MGHWLGGVLSATPAFSCLRPERALTSLESAIWITAYRTPRTALRNLYTASRAGLTGGTGRDVDSNFWLRGGWLPAAGSSARSPSGLTASAASFVKVSTPHERWPGALMTRRSPPFDDSFENLRGRNDSGPPWGGVVRGVGLQIGYREFLIAG